MLEKLAAIEERYEELNNLLMEVGGDYQRAAELNMERTELEPLVVKAREYRQIETSLEEARTLLDSDDEELRLLAETEIAELAPRLDGLDAEIRTMLVPKDPRPAQCDR